MANSSRVLLMVCWIAVGYLALSVSSSAVQDQTEVQNSNGEEYTNIAKYGIATQESTGWGGYADKAIDGNTSGDYEDTFSCTHNQYSSNRTWWNLAFSTPVQVDKIVVWNRADYTFAIPRIHNVEVYVDKTLCGTIEYKEDDDPDYTIDCGIRMTSNITVVGGYWDGYMALCEVQVLSTSPPAVCLDEIENGSVYPEEVIEGFVMTVTCDKGFKVDGNWKIVCKAGGNINNESNEKFSECVPLKPEQCEIGEFGGFLKAICQDNSRMTLKCPYSDTMYDIVEEFPGRTVFDDICENDAKFYQACGSGHGIGITSDAILCNQYVCKNKNTDDVTTYSCKMKTENQCDNIQNEQTCPNVGYIEICNDVCDYKNCEDEGNCNGLQYGIFCTENEYVFFHGGLAISVLTRRDGSVCKIWGPSESDSREKFLETYTGDTCTHSISGYIVPIFNFTRCAALEYNTHSLPWYVNDVQNPYCSNYRDQMNCSDPTRVAMSCLVNGRQTKISMYAICHGRPGVSMCDNGMENNCKSLSSSCFIHKHKLCDGVQDCTDGSDELDLACKEMTEVKCVRVLGSKDLSIPLAWLGDGLEDCQSGEDELTTWPTCGTEQTSRYVLNNYSCSDDFLCLNSDVKFISQKQLCDNIDTCGNENGICKLSRGSRELFTKMTHGNICSNKEFSYCLKGLENLQQLDSNCQKMPFQFPPEKTFGLKELKTINMPDASINCDFTFGEVYLYASCTNKCMSSDCPLTRPIKHDSCSGQFPDRVYTVVNNDYVTFVAKSHEMYENDYFLCDNNRCISYNKVCDLVDDCGDESDEETCTNHVQCNSTGTRIPKWKKCDGVINCEDLSDECNAKCGKEIIEGLLLKVLSWIIGFLAVTFNCFIIFQNIKSLKDISTSMGLVNKLAIVLIGLGDFLIGGYLFTVSMIDAVIGPAYCNQQTQWLSSDYCSFLGIISTVGSQFSLFSMTCLSITRLFSIKNALTLPTGQSWMLYAKISSFMAVIVLSSVGIAVIPILPQFEDFFVNGMRYEETNPLFVGYPNKKIHLQVLQGYYGRSRGDASSISWSTIVTLTDGMFSNNYGGIERKKIDFYGNDGVCLFKYFVTENDPQRLFSWGVLAVNFICFVVISLSYLFINIISMSRGSSLKNIRHVNERNRKMQRKISIIIATDFCCWVPFVIICILHSLSVFDATPWYALFSIVILPINSVINPLLCDNTLTNCFSKPVRGIITSFSTIRVQNLLVTSEQPQQPCSSKSLSCDNGTVVRNIKKREVTCKINGLVEDTGEEAMKDKMVHNWMGSTVV